MKITVKKNDEYVERRKKLELEFQELTEPLNQWLQRNFSPHDRIIAEFDNAEVVSGELVVPFKVND